MIDSYGRKINYLRLSITDRCNMRCRYCLPPQGVKKLQRDEILNYDELLRIAESAVKVGIEKIRITGGEPLVRKGVIGFISALSGIEGLKQLVLTTNGLLLEGMAEELKSAGIQRLNVSLDSLKHDVFSSITGGGDLNRVLAGINAAENVGLPVKINMVVIRGINDEEVFDFASIAMRKPYAIRFIEYMPAIKEKNWQRLIVPSREILARISRSYNLRQIPRGELAGPAKVYCLEEGTGTIGVISPLSGHFCRNCNRIRVTSTGVAKSCLFSADEINLRPYLRTHDVNELLNAIHHIITIKPDMHRLTETRADHIPFSMVQIGG